MMATPHQSRSAPPVSLRLGHARGKNNTQLFSKTLAPLRYPLEKATVIDTSNNRLKQIEN